MSSQIKKLIKALLEGKMSEAKKLTDNILQDKSSDKLNELKAKKKFVIRGGKKIKKFIGKKGFDQSGGKLTKRKGSEVLKKKKSAKKAAKSGLKHKAQKVRNQKKSIKKRQSQGLK